MNSEEIKNFFAYDFRKFLKIDFLKYIFFSLDGRIDRKTWWYSKLYLYIVAFLFMIPIGALFSALSFDQNDLAKVIVFFSLIFSAFSVFLDAKRLQDRSITGLLAVVPYLLAIPQYFKLIPQDVAQFYVWIIFGFNVWIFVNAGFLKGDEGDNKYGPNP
tara:strand:+ start:4667 stop:5143 length:477 start_codon:yes stop_codon:yes gene_type:complete